MRTLILSLDPKHHLEDPEGGRLWGVGEDKSVLRWHMDTDLGLVERVDELLIVQDIALRLKQQLEDPVFYGFQLVLVSVDTDDKLVTLFLKVRSLQLHNITVSTREHKFG